MISKNMLCSSATAYKVTEYDEDRNPVYSEGQELSAVYINYYTAQNNGSNGQTPASGGALYYDPKHSQPSNYKFEKGQRLDVDGEKYYVTKIAPYYNADGLHHYLVEFE